MKISTVIGVGLMLVGHMGWAGEPATTLTAAKPPAGPTQWKVEKVLFIPWGSGEREIGIRKVPLENGETGIVKGLPKCFTVGPDQSIYIGDDVGDFLHVFDGKGNFVKRLSCEWDFGLDKGEAFWDIVIDGGHIYGLASRRRVQKISLRDWAVKHTYDLPDALPLKPSRLTIQGGMIQVGGELEGEVKRQDGMIAYGGSVKGSPTGYHLVTVGTIQGEKYDFTKQQTTLQRGNHCKGVVHDGSLFLENAAERPLFTPKRSESSGLLIGVAAGWAYMQTASIDGFRFGQDSISARSFGVFRVHLQTGKREEIPVDRAYGQQLLRDDSFADRCVVFVLAETGTLYQLVGDDAQGVTLYKIYAP